MVLCPSRFMIFCHPWIHLTEFSLRSFPSASGHSGMKRPKRGNTVVGNICVDTFGSVNTLRGRGTVWKFFIKALAVSREQLRELARVRWATTERSQAEITTDHHKSDISPSELDFEHIFANVDSDLAFMDDGRAFDWDWHPSSHWTKQKLVIPWWYADGFPSPAISHRFPRQSQRRKYVVFFQRVWVTFSGEMSPRGDITHCSLDWNSNSGAYLGMRSDGSPVGLSRVRACGRDRFRVQRELQRVTNQVSLNPHDRGQVCDKRLKSGAGFIFWEPNHNIESRKVAVVGNFSVPDRAARFRTSVGIAQEIRPWMTRKTPDSIFWRARAPASQREPDSWWTSSTLPRIERFTGATKRSLFEWLTIRSDGSENCGGRSPREALLDSTRSGMNADSRLVHTTTRARSRSSTTWIRSFVSSLQKAKQLLALCHPTTLLETSHFVVLEVASLLRKAPRKWIRDCNFRAARVILIDQMDKERESPPFRPPTPPPDDFE